MAPTGDGFFTYNSQLDAFTLYHIVQEETVGTNRKDYGGPALPALGHATAGAVASAVTKAIVYPIDTITTRLQVQKALKGEKETDSAASDADAEYKDPIDAARKIWKNEGGIKAFYTGLGSDVVKGLADSFLFFFAYSMLRDQMVKRQGGRQLPVLKELSVGIAAGAFSKGITSPIQNIVTRQQTAALTAARNPTSSTTTPAQSDRLSVKDIALQIRSEKGIAGFWAGYSAQLILTLNPAITFAVDNMLKGLIPKKWRDQPTATQTFLVAALSKVIATTITYPVMLAKSRAQAAQTPSSNDVDPSDRNVDVTSTPTQKRARQVTRQLRKLVDGQVALLNSLRRIYRQEGVSGLYAGLEGEVVKGFIQHGLTMTIKDSVHGSVIQLYYLLLKLTKRWPEEFDKVQKEVQKEAGVVAKEAGAVAKDVAEGTKQVGKKLTGQE